MAFNSKLHRLQRAGSNQGNARWSAVTPRLSTAAGRLPVRLGSQRQQQQHRWRTALPCRAASDESQFDVDTARPEKTKEDSELGPRADDVLPDSLAGAVQDAASATANAVTRGNTRCMVELLLPEFWDPISGPIFPNRGDQERFWRMTRRFVEQLAQETGITNIKAVYPDAGVAAMLSYQWQDKSFTITSLNDRRPVQSEDELIVIACPDPPGADGCMRLVRMVSEQDEKEGMPERPVVMFNQRLSSGDVGLGLNARRIRDRFLRKFTVTYSLKPIGELGSVFRKYPGMWQVFVEDAGLPGRYKLIKEQPSRPQGEALDFMIMQALDPSASAPGQGEGAQGASFLDQLRRTMTSLQYFMKSLSN